MTSRTCKACKAPLAELAHYCGACGAAAPLPREEPQSPTRRTGAPQRAAYVCRVPLAKRTR